MDIKMNMTRLQRRAEFVYNAARLAAIASRAPVIPPEWNNRKAAFKEKFLTVIALQCSDYRVNSPENLHDNWMESYYSMGWVYGDKYNLEKKTHPDLVPYEKLGKLEQDKDSVFFVLCEIARQWVH